MATPTRIVDLTQVELSPQRPQGAPKYRPTSMEIANAQHYGIAELMRVRVAPGSNRQQFELLTGERAWATAVRAQIMEVEVLVIEATDREALSMIQQDLGQRRSDAMVIARQYCRLRDEGKSGAEISRLHKVHRSHVTRHLALLTLPPSIQSKLEAGQLTEGQARHLCGLPIRVQEELSEKVIAESLSVEATRLLAAARSGHPVADSAVGRDRERLVDEGKWLAETDPDTLKFARELTDHFGYPVQLERRRDGSGGRLCFEYFKLDDLESILDHTDFTFR